MRVFYAIEFDEETKQKINALKKAIEPTIKEAKFLPQHNYHITLKYIGYIKETTLPKLKKVIDDVSHQNTPFKLTMSHFETFKKGSKHILYLGLSHSHQLHQLKNTLEEACSTVGYKKDTRLYKPHITLSKKTVFKHTFNQNIKEFTYTVTGVSLMLSHRVNGILTYDRLYYKGFDTDDINETHRTTL